MVNSSGIACPHWPVELPPVMFKVRPRRPEWNLQVLVGRRLAGPWGAAEEIVRDGTWNKRHIVWLGRQDNHTYQTHVTGIFQKVGGDREARAEQDVLSLGYLREPRRM